MVISHRGRKTGERENSIEAFEEAFRLGAGGIECDARLNLGGEVVISHDDVSKSDSSQNLLTLDDLFIYIQKKKMPFFIEVKSSSPVLIEKISEKIGQENLWNQVYVIGFSVMIKTALKMQKKYPKLRVIPFLNLPILSFIRPPEKSYGVFMGWIDEWPASQFLFRKLISQQRLEKLVKLYQENGFKVMAGVINNSEGVEYFKNAGITDIVTDEIIPAAKILNSK